MAYLKQNFVSGQVFTEANADQIESNIRDHQHGIGGVGASGLSWIVASANAAFTVVNSMANTNWQCSSSFQITFDAAASLGKAFGAGFTNIGSGRVVLAAAAGQMIGPSSLFILTPTENINVWSDGSKLQLFGHTKGDFLIHRELSTTSRAVSNVLIQMPWINDFSQFKIALLPSQVASHSTIGSRIVMQFSVNSGTGFLTSAYSFAFDNDVTANPGSGMVLVNGTGFAGIGSPQVVSGEYTLTKGAWLSGSQSAFTMFGNNVTRANSNADYSRNVSMFATTSAQALLANSVNSFRLLGDTTAYFSNFEMVIWGVR